MYAVNRPLDSHLPSPKAAPLQTRAARSRMDQTQHPTQLRQRAQKQNRIHWAIALETTVKLSVNLGLSAVAIAALVQLIPYQFSQQSRLQELQVASKTSMDRLRGVQNNFQHYFDPYSARSIMAEQTNRVDPKERTIVLQRPSAGSLSYQINNFKDLSQQRVERGTTGY